MKSLKFLITIALIANLLTLILYKNEISKSNGGGSSMMLIVGWMPLLWSLTMIFIATLAIINREALFQKPIRKWTQLVLLFATPLPIFTFYYFTHMNDKVARTGSGENQLNGKVYYFEDWEYPSSHKVYVYKYFVADSIDILKYGKNESLKKDRTWVYHNENGDTSKIEYYRNDTLISREEFKSR